MTTGAGLGRGTGAGDCISTPPPQLCGGGGHSRGGGAQPRSSDAVGAGACLAEQSLGWHCQDGTEQRLGRSGGCELAGARGAELAGGG